jgi:hypothetical protein
MPTAKELQEGILPFYQELLVDPKERVPHYMHVMEWIGYATMYKDAARELHEPAPQFALPRLQLSGHAMECALKACIVAKGEAPARTHDLVQLVDTVVSLGYVVIQRDLGSIVHLNQNYFSSMLSGTRFKARYPALHFQGRREPAVSSLLIDRIVIDLCRQAHEVNELNNRERFLAGHSDPAP